MKLGNIRTPFHILELKVKLPQDDSAPLCDSQEHVAKRLRLDAADEQSSSEPASEKRLQKEHAQPPIQQPMRQISPVFASKVESQKAETSRSSQSHCPAKRSHSTSSPPTLSPCRLGKQPDASVPPPHLPISAVTTSKQTNTRALDGSSAITPSRVSTILQPSPPTKALISSTECSVVTTRHSVAVAGTAAPNNTASTTSLHIQQKSSSPPPDSSTTSRRLVRELEDTQEAEQLYPKALKWIHGRTHFQRMDLAEGLWVKGSITDKLLAKLKQNGVISRYGRGLVTPFEETMFCAGFAVVHPQCSAESGEA